MVVQLVVGSYLRSVKVCCGATLGSVCLLSVQPAFVAVLHTLSSSIGNSIPGSLSIVVPNNRPQFMPNIGSICNHWGSNFTKRDFATLRGKVLSRRAREHCGTAPLEILHRDQLISKDKQSKKLR